MVEHLAGPGLVGETCVREGDGSPAGIPAPDGATSRGLGTRALVGDGAPGRRFQQHRVVGVAVQVVQRRVDRHDLGFAPGACREGAGPEPGQIDSSDRQVDEGDRRIHGCGVHDPLTGHDQEPVGPVLSVVGVGSGAAVQAVVAITSGQVVVARAAVQPVATVLPVQGVIARTTLQPVVAITGD